MKVYTCIQDTRICTCMTTSIISTHIKQTKVKYIHNSTFNFQPVSHIKQWMAWCSFSKTTRLTVLLSSSSVARSTLSCDFPGGKEIRQWTQGVNNVKNLHAFVSNSLTDRRGAYSYLTTDPITKQKTQQQTGTIAVMIIKPQGHYEHSLAN